MEEVEGEGEEQEKEVEADEVAVLTKGLVREVREYYVVAKDENIQNETGDAPYLPLSHALRHMSYTYPESVSGVCDLAASPSGLKG